MFLILISWSLYDPDDPPVKEDSADDDQELKEPRPELHQPARVP